MYKVEELNFLHKKYECFKTNRGDVYDDSDVTTEDKIKLLDEICDGLATYLLKLIDKFQRDKDTIKKDNEGNYDIKSFNRWVKRNDKRQMLEPFNITGAKKYYYFLSNFYSIEEGRKAIYDYTNYDYPNDFLLITNDTIKNWYNDLVRELIRREELYLKQQDTHDKMILEIKEYENKYGNPLMSQEVYNICDKGKENVKYEVLERILESYKRYEELLKQFKKKFKDID